MSLNLQKNNSGTLVNVYALEEEKVEKPIKNIVYPQKGDKNEESNHFDILEKTHIVIKI